eukprot:2702793-Pyramimonas_sp.AAC.1
MKGFARRALPGSDLVQKPDRCRGARENPGGGLRRFVQLQIHVAGQQISVSERGCAGAAVARPRCHWRGQGCEDPEQSFLGRLGGT